MKDLIPFMEVSPWYTASLVLLAIFFALLVGWVFSSVRREQYERAAELPLHDGRKVHGSN